MAQLVYSAIASLDGYIEDVNGSFEWAAPDTEVFECINELERPIGTHLYGRRMYETMTYWETLEEVDDEDPAIRDFTTIWRAADKVVYSRTLDAVTTARTRLERTFDPAAVQAMKAAAGHDLSIGGAELAGQALAAGLVDELHLFFLPIAVGSGKAALAGRSVGTLELTAVERFTGGAVHVHYRINR